MLQYVLGNGSTIYCMTYRSCYSSGHMICTVRGWWVAKYIITQYTLSLWHGEVGELECIALQECITCEPHQVKFFSPGKHHSYHVLLV